jgi:hypothetical protein
VNDHPNRGDQWRPTLRWTEADSDFFFFDGPSVTDRPTDAAGELDHDVHSDNGGSRSSNIDQLLSTVIVIKDHQKGRSYAWTSQITVVSSFVDSSEDNSGNEQRESGQIEMNKLLSYEESQR